jgi:membrane protease subunit (stomatin/prohibitin family)
VGLVLVDFKVAEITPSAKSAQELRDMGLIDMQTYMQLQAADAMRDAANAPGGNLAGAGVGVGAGMGLGQMMAQSFQGGMQPQQPQQQQAAPAADDPVAKLGKLKQMLDAGLITQEEYDAKKTDILSQM